ncbi:MAG: cbb3-type cytochrome oxidase assembly protein [Isosphaeraceae bacterium]
MSTAAPVPMTPAADRKATLRKQRITTLVFALVILLPSGYGFSRKLMELLALTSGEVDGAFAVTPVVNYLLSSLGFFFLFCWAIFNGMFGDIEGPKRRMLQLEQELDQDEDPVWDRREEDDGL